MARRVPKKLILLPLAALLLSAATLVVLDRKGVVDLAWIPGGDDAGATDGKKKGKKGASAAKKCKKRKKK